MNSPTNLGPSEKAALLNWLRRFFSCNPLYLASAGLLLYGINRLSSEPGMAGAESEQITFNFAALFIYEILLVWTAIMLARRTIWYDALLLVGMENLFVLIPFSLVSRAVQLDEPLGRKLCGAAVLLAVLKFWALRRYIPRLNLPPRLLAFGALTMAANVALALGLRRVYDDPRAVNSWLTFGWLFGLPAFVALGNFLPRPTRSADSPEQRAWLPYAALGIWVAVTGFHLGGVGYVFSFKWTPALLAPTLWVLAWTLLVQLGALLASPTPQRRALIISPLVVTLLATDDPRLFFALNLLNAVGFAWAWWHNRTSTLLLLSVISVTASSTSLPVEWVSQILPGLSRPEWALACFTAALLGPIIASRNPRWTIAGALLCFAAAAVLANRVEASLHWAAQAGLVFGVAHSLRWRDTEVAGARAARIFLCITWMAQSSLWALTTEHEALYGCYISSSVVLAFFGLHRLTTGMWMARVVPGSAVAVFLSPPVAHFAERLKSVPPGYLAVAGSFLLFGLGTLAALTKHRWQKNEGH